MFVIVIVYYAHSKKLKIKTLYIVVLFYGIMCIISILSGTISHRCLNSLIFIYRFKIVNIICPIIIVQKTDT